MKYKKINNEPPTILITYKKTVKTIPITKIVAQIKP